MADTNNFNLSGDEARILMYCLSNTEASASIKITIDLYLRLAAISHAQPIQKNENS